MKLLFDTREQTRNITGIGTYVRNLAREIQALQLPGVECVCIPDGPGTPPGKEVRPLHVQVLNFARNLGWKQLYLPARTLRERADVLVCMDPIAPLYSPAPTVLLVYDLIFMTSTAQSDAWTRYWRLMVPRSVRRAARIFTLSRAAKEKIVRLIGVPEDRISVFHTGVADHFREMGWSQEEAAARRRETGLPESFLLSVGAHDPRRNLPTLLEAYGRVRARGVTRAGLVVVGPQTPYFEEVKRKTAALGLEDCVRYVDYVPNEELYVYYNLADLYLYPSSEEGFGLTPLEAMACGCPVITSRASSLPEVVGDAALTVDPRDPVELAEAVERVLTDPDLRASLVERGRERARRFSWQAGARDIVEGCVELGRAARS